MKPKKDVLESPGVLDDGVTKHSDVLDPMPNQMPTVEEELQMKLDSSQQGFARLYEEYNRLNNLVTQLAKKQSIPTGEAPKEFFDMDCFLRYDLHGRRFADMVVTGRYEEQLGEALEPHFVYALTWITKNGDTDIEKNVTYKQFRSKMMLCTKVPCTIPEALRRIKEGNNYVYRSVRAMQGRPYGQSEDVEVILGRTLPDGKTHVYDGDRATVKFHSLNIT